MAFVQLFKPAIAILSALTFNVLTFPTFAQPTGAKNYIVVLKKDINPSAVALEHANIHALNVAFTYNNAIKGYAARIPEARLAILKKIPVFYLYQRIAQSVSLLRLYQLELNAFKLTIVLLSLATVQGV